MKGLSKKHTDTDNSMVIAKGKGGMGVGGNGQKGNKWGWKETLFLVMSALCSMQMMFY